MTEIVKRLKDIAQEQNITQKELAKRTHTTEASISRWFNDTRIPDAKYLERMAAALGYRLTIEKDSKCSTQKLEKIRQTLDDLNKETADKKVTRDYWEGFCKVFNTVEVALNENSD